MITGIGTDIVEIDRIERSIAQYGDQFLLKYFSEAEREYCLGKPRQAEHIAVRFAAKEALFKAASTIFPEQYNWSQASIEHSKFGDPRFVFYDALDAPFSPFKVLVSLSHTHRYANAMVIVEKIF